MWKRLHIRLKRHSRASERGSAIFIVMLVLVVLTGIGVFATRAAGLNQTTSGYNRQATQTGYVADYSMWAAADELGSGSGQSIQQTALAPNQHCASLAGLDAGGLPAPDCYQMDLNELQASLTKATPGAFLFDTTGQGSLGPANTRLVPHSIVEITEGVQSLPLPGSEASGTNGSQITKEYTLTASGQVRPASTSATDGGTCSTPSEIQAAVAAGHRSSQAIVRIRTNTPGM